MSKLGPTSTELEPTATERLRALLDERGLPWKDYGYENHTWWGAWHAENKASVNGLFVKVEGVVTPEQAVEATLGRETCETVYLVETSDDLIESWYPLGVYLHREAAEDCAEALRKEEDGIRYFAKVRELKVVEE